MKSKEVIVPRSLIKEFHVHPEDYGDESYVVVLLNGMYTDVFYKEEGDFVTITNNKKLISYLKKNYIKPYKYFYQKSFFSFREVAPFDQALLDDWKDKKSIEISFNIDFVEAEALFLLCFYWIEVGIVKVKNNKVIINVYDDIFIKEKDIQIAKEVLVDYYKSNKLNKE